MLIGIITLLAIVIGGNSVEYQIQKQKQKEKERQELIQKTNELDAQLKAKEQERLNLENKTKELEQKLQAKAQVRVASVTTIPKTEQEAKIFIYLKESGNRTNAINKSSGACGLGQALPCSKLGCSLDDYACQDAWFTNYALRRYGSWVGAYQFWLQHHWW